MEGSMDNEVKKQSFDFDFDLPPKLEFENAADAIGLWFAAVVVFAFVTAGVIVYRTANPEFAMAANDAVPVAAAQSDPIAPAPLLLPRR
jgi:hypothetical protein